MLDRGSAPDKQLTLPFAPRRGEASVGASGKRPPGKGILPNRRIRDPYVRWCGRGEAVRPLPIPIRGGKGHGAGSPPGRPA